MSFPPQKLMPALFIGLSLWVFNTQAATPTYTNTRQTLQQTIETLMKQNGIVGLSIALVDDQNVVWAEGFGYADKAKKHKATPETIYRAGSVSKLFTATATMQLVEQGKFDIDKSLQTYIPEFSIKTRFAEAGPITLRHLMTHHSGLPEDYRIGWRTTRPVESFTQLVDKLPNEYTANPPNLILAYSNLAVSLLGTAIENTCSAPFSTCLEQNLFKPLGMSNTEFASGASDSALMSKEYGRTGLVPASFMRDVPAGGLNSNALDLSRFMSMLFANGAIDGKQLISANSLNEMLRPQNADFPLDLDNRVGLAWFLEHTTSGETMAHHGGDIGHFHSFLATIPSHKLGVVVLANTDSAGGVVMNIAKSALNLMLSDKSADFRAAQALPTPTANNPNPYTLTGQYASEYVGLIRISDNRGRMRIKLLGKSFPLVLQPDGSAKFTYANFGGEVTLRRDELSARQVLILDSPATGRLLLGEKLAQPNLSKLWRQRLGRYQITNKGDEVDIPTAIYLQIKDGYLVVTGGPAVPAFRVLTPLNDQEAIIAGLGRGLGETVTFETHGKQQKIRYLGLLAQRRAR